VALVNPEYNRKNRDVLYVSITIIAAVFLFTMTVSILNESTLGHHTASLTDAYAQPSVETVKHRNLTIDLGNGLKTNAELTIPAVGEGPFPGVLIIPGSGVIDRNGTEGYILVDNVTGSKIYPTAQTYFDISKYLSERGFAVLKYDKRGVGSNHTVLDSNVWGNVTINDLKQDAETALAVLLQQPEVNATEKATLIGHSEGTIVTPRVAADNSDKVKNIVLMAAFAQNLGDLLEFQVVENPLLYAERELDNTGQGVFSLKDAMEDPIFLQIGGHLLNQTHLAGGDDDVINIEDELRAAALVAYENITSPSALVLSSECQSQAACPVAINSHMNLESTVDMMGNVSSGVDILILQAENDSLVPNEQGLLLQQRLTQVNHPDHLLITYPNLGHLFAPSNQWITEEGPVEEYVLQDMFEWLASPERSSGGLSGESDKSVQILGKS
jgi:alpha-beta hydrolase superfamily lysophospholipase